MLTVFTDFHHSGLLASLIRLFETRFDGRVYRPIGREWYEQGYWKVYDHPATVAQYLDINGATPDGSEPLNQTEGYLSNLVGIYHCKDIAGGGLNRAITLDWFFHTKIDLVIASIPAHVLPFRELCNRHPNHPKLIYQIGNAWNISADQEAAVDGILASAKLQREPVKPYVIYHQEFDSNLFSEVSMSGKIPAPKISSFVNCFNTDQLFSYDWGIFQEVEKAMPEWSFKAYGGGCRDGHVAGERGVAESMIDSRFVWHTKNGGDGYGHVIHNAFAIGRPPIVRHSYYADKLAGDLMIDGVNCLYIDGLGVEEIVNKILFFSDPVIYRALSKMAAWKFRQLVDFDKEAESIRSMIESL